MRRRDHVMEFAAGLMLPLLIGLAGVLSYTALRELATKHGYANWEASLWPLVVDAFALAAMLTAMVVAARHYGPNLESWGLTGAAIVVTVTGNVLSAGSDPIAQLMHAWPPIALVACWHLWTRYVSARAEAPQKQASPDLRASRAEESATEPNRLPARLPARAEVRRLLKRSGADLDAGAVVRRTGVSRRHAAKLLREERQPRVMDASSLQREAER